MTQAAIDLVQAELETSTDTPSRVSGDQSIAPPDSLCVARSAKEHRPKNIDRYGWYDCGGAYVKLEIQLKVKVKEVRCEFGARSARISICDAQDDTHILRLPNLAADVNADACGWFVRGRKVFVTLSKVKLNKWERLVADRSPSTQRADRSEVVPIEMLRRQFLTTRSFAKPPIVQSDLPAAPISRPLTRIVRRVHENELTLVQKWTLLGADRVRLGDFVEARDGFSNALEELHHLASTQSSRSDLAFLDADVIQRPVVDPQRIFIMASELHHRLAKCFVELGQLKDAVQLCSAAIEELKTVLCEDDELMIDVLLTRANALESLEDYNGAYSDFKNILKHSRQRRAMDGMRRVDRRRTRSDGRPRIDVLDAAL